MFSTSTAKRVAREAEKIVSLKEDMDAVSWTRVLEIGNQLQEGVDEAERVSLARELVSIAQSNRSLYTRLGLDPEPSSSRVMASGIEVMEGGLAEAAIEKRGDRGGRRPPIIEAPSIEPEVFVEEPSETDFQAAGVQAECDLVAKNDPDESDFIEAAEAVARVDSPSAPLPVDPEPVDPPRRSRSRSRDQSRSRSRSPWLRPKRSRLGSAVSRVFATCTKAATAACASSRTSTGTSWPSTRRSSPSEREEPRRALRSFTPPVSWGRSCPRSRSCTT